MRVMLSPSPCAGHTNVLQHLMVATAAECSGQTFYGPALRMNSPVEPPRPSFPAGHTEALQQLQQLMPAAAALVPSIQRNLQVLPEDGSRPAISTGTHPKVRNR